MMADVSRIISAACARRGACSHAFGSACFIRRQTDAQLEAAHAQIIASRAEEMAAKASIATAARRLQLVTPIGTK